MDIVKSISAIEKLKCGILTETACLFDSMSSNKAGSDCKEILSRLLIDVYLLAERLDIDYSMLDEAAVLRLKTELFSDKKLTDREASDGEFADNISLNKSRLIRHLVRYE